jgi:glucose-6-phosphate 1-epimerase
VVTLARRFYADRGGAPQRGPVAAILDRATETHMAETPEALDRRHGLPGIAHVVGGHGGLPKVLITTPAARGEIYLHGAQVTSWTPAGHADALFVSAASRWEPGRAIRGGIPICFPWFGNRAGDPQAPAHGFVRTRAWTLDSIAEGAAGITITVTTESDEQTRARWPFEFRLRLRATFGPVLDVEIAAANTGGASLTFEEALHAYYAVGDVSAVRIAGLDGVRYLDKVDGGSERLQRGEISIAGETDRVYSNTTSATAIHDPALKRRIHVGKSHSQSTVVWNPWIDKARALADLQDDDWTRMVCVEAGNVHPDGIVLAPGQEHRMALSVTVTSLEERV